MKTELKGQTFSRILSAAVNVFHVFKLNNFRSNFKSVFKNSVLIKTLQRNHFSKPVLLTCEQELRIEFPFLLSINEVEVSLFSLKIKG